MNDINQTWTSPDCTLWSQIIFKNQIVTEIFLRNYHLILLSIFPVGIELFSQQCGWNLKISSSSETGFNVKREPNYHWEEFRILLLNHEFIFYRFAMNSSLRRDTLIINSFGLAFDHKTIAIICTYL